jgi:hypothetical protein
MTLEAIVKEDGMLIAQAPKSLWGKKITITVQEDGPQKQTGTQWDDIAAILQEARTLDIPRRTIDEILADVREFRLGSGA